MLSLAQFEPIKELKVDDKLISLFFPVNAKPKKYVRGLIAKPPLTRVEILTEGLIRPSDEVKANFSIKEDEKGRGVYLKIPELPKGSFVLEYEGDIITPDQMEQREKIYESNGEGCFIMEFRFKGSRMAIDATRNFDSYTRLLNHSRHPNIRFHSPIVVNFSDPKPRIAAYALKDIKRGEEIVFDYGVKDSSIPWLKNRKIGFAEVSEDEEGDTDSKDNESTSSSESTHLCLRYTAARAGRLDGYDKPAFNYRELSRSGSSSSETFSQSSKYCTKKGRKKECSKSSQSQPISEKSTVVNTFKTSLNQSTNLGLDIITQPVGSIECRWHFDCLKNKEFQVTFSKIAVPQKILKCLEPKRRCRRIECTGSVICLSSESSPSQESTIDSDPNELPDMPEISSKKKVMDWQNSLCYEESSQNNICEESAQNNVCEENPLNIKIVGVQSLSDSPEHTLNSTEPPHQKTDPINSQLSLPIDSIESFQNNSSVHESKSISTLQLVTPKLTNSTSITVASPSQQHLPQSPLETEHNSSSVPNLSSATTISMDWTHHTTQGISLQHKHFVSNPSRREVLHQSSLNSDLPASLTGSSNEVLLQPSQKPESPVTISDSEDQPSFESAKQPKNFIEQSLEKHVGKHLQGNIPIFVEKIVGPSYVSSHSLQRCHNPPPNHLHATDKVHTGSSFGRPPMLQQNFLPLSKERDYRSPSKKSYLSQQQDHQRNCLASRNSSLENRKPATRPQNFVNGNALGKRVESFVISDDEDNPSGKSRDHPRKSVGKSFNGGQSREQNVYVLSSGDESDVEIVPCTPKPHSSTSVGVRNKSASKFESEASGFTANIKSNIKIDDSEYDLVFVEQSSQSASATKRVAVIQPYISDLSHNDACQSNNALTNAEMDQLSEIFDRHSFSRNVSKADINDKIHKHWKFFKSILERGISVKQIRTAVKQMCLDKYKGSI